MQQQLRDVYGDSVTSDSADVDDGAEGAEDPHITIRKRFLAGLALTTVLRIFAFKRQIAMNMMAAGFKMTDNGLTFWLCHDWYHSTPGGRANLDSFVNQLPIVVAR
eukprot:SAG31_NODE_95_length_25901_cov_24.763700_30_plen_106_part_00